MILQERSKRKNTTGRYKSGLRKKRWCRAGSLPTFTKLGTKKMKTIRVIGGNKKEKLLSEENVNLVDPKTKKASKVKILNVIDNSANRHFIRRNILTKGTTIKTEKGDAIITSRPGQVGVLNAVLKK